jgi:AcrR family transcriptional regulator
MKIKKHITTISKDCIAESLLILMRKKAFSDITIGEITQKAGVNRSTYYRNFNSKEEIVKYSIIKIVYENVRNNDKKYIPYRKQVFESFNHFLKYKNELMVIYKNGLSHYILEVFNEKFISIGGQKSPEDLYKAYWHIGGIYNILFLWFSKDMDTPVERLTELFIANFPKRFSKFIIL